MAGLVILGCVSLQVRDDRQVTRALDCRRQLTLMTCARPTQAARKDLSLVRDETAERAVVLIVDPANASFAERAAFLWSSHDWLILVVVVIVTACCLCRHLFFAHRRCADFVLVQRYQVANDAAVELERALVLWQHGWLGGEA